VYTFLGINPGNQVPLPTTGQSDFLGCQDFCIPACTVSSFWMP